MYIEILKVADEDAIEVYESNGGTLIGLNIFVRKGWVCMTPDECDDLIEMLEEAKKAVVLVEEI